MIGIIQKSIKDALKNGMDIDNKKLTNMAMSQFGISKRTAQEYIDVANWQLQEGKDENL